MSIPKINLTPHVVKCLSRREKLLMCLVVTIREQPSRQITRPTDTYWGFFGHFTRYESTIHSKSHVCLTRNEHILLTHTQHTGCKSFGQLCIWMVCHITVFFHFLPPYTRLAAYMSVMSRYVSDETDTYLSFILLIRFLYDTYVYCPIHVGHYRYMT